MPMTFKGPRGAQITVRLGAYTKNDQLAVELFDEEGPYAMLSCNLDEKLDEGEFFVKTWSENEEIAAYALKSGLFVDTGRYSVADVQAPIWRLAGGQP